MDAKTLKGPGTTIGTSDVIWDNRSLSRPARSYGRNGSILTAGIALTLHHRPKEDEGDLTMAVITSRGQTSHNCYIELPADPRVLLRLAKELKESAKAIEDGRLGLLSKV